MDKVYYCYKATNRVNNKAYIGFAADPKKRWRQHKAYAIQGKGYAFHEAIRKHGWDAFTFEVVCCGKDKRAMLEHVEPALIDQYESRITQHGYNMHRKVVGASGRTDDRRRPRTAEEKAASSESVKALWTDPIYRANQLAKRKEYFGSGAHPMKGKRHSKEAIQKMSETTTAMITDEQREQMRLMSIEQWADPVKRAALIERSRNPSDETRQKMSVAKQGKPSWNKGLTHSPESIERMRAAKKGKKASAETKLKMSESRKRYLHPEAA